MQRLPATIQARAPAWATPRVGTRFAAGAAVVGAAAFLLARLVPDVHAKPLFEDEAVAGLIAAQSPWQIVVTTLWDRGGAPVHFLLAHLTFAFDPSASALRWLSVVFAVATIPLCYDLGRRLDGRIAGVTAAVVAAGSGMLGVYGTFGRMYALLAFAGALAADLFVRALDLRTTKAVAAAAAAAWLLPAVHPYGGIVVAIEALVALALWRGRPLRAAIPVALIGAALIPFAVADLRLAERFEVGSRSPQRLATAREAWYQLGDAVRGFAGGSGWTLVVFVLLATAGAALLARRRPAFVALGLLALVVPPFLSALVHTSSAPDLSPRYLIFVLPFWAAFIGAAVARAPASLLAAGAVAALAVISPQGIHDPRSTTYTAAFSKEDALAAPAAWLRARVEPNDVLYPYASVFLAALPEAGEATTLPRAQPGPILDALERVEYPVGAVYVAVPTGRTGVDPVPQGRQFDRWLFVRRAGPLTDDAAVLREIDGALRQARRALRGPVPEPLAGWFDLNTSVVCESLRALGSGCPAD